MEIIKKLGGRKFSLAVFVLVAASVFAFTGVLEMEQWMDFAKWIIGLFIVGNVANKAATKITSKPEA